MAGMPIAAVVQPKPANVPASAGVLTPGEVRAQEHLPHVNITINNVRPLTARDRDKLASVIGDALTSQVCRVPR